MILESFVKYESFKFVIRNVLKDLLFKVSHRRVIELNKLKKLETYCQTFEINKSFLLLIISGIVLLIFISITDEALSLLRI